MSENQHPDYRRHLFLVGEGTLTAREIAGWAHELWPVPYAPAADIDPETPLMVSVIPKDTTT